MDNKEKTVSPEEETTKDNADERHQTEKFGYKVSTIVLSIALIASLSVFLFIRYMEEKSYVPPVIETFATTEKETSSETLHININAADKTELQQLPGIGEGKAEAIVEYRLEYGLFSTTEEIMNVSGIGEGLFEKISEYIYVGE